MNVSQNVLDAIDILTDNAVQKAKYDKTIQAVILSCQDETIGQYKCKYQDSSFLAYGTNTDVVYTQGSMVYVQIPQGDFSKQKTILGSTNRLGINYISQAIGDQAYDKIGINCIELSKQVYLDTNNKDYIFTIYEAGDQSTDSIITINNLAISTYLKKSSSIILGASIQTSIDSSRQFRGHYGIIFNLVFNDNASGNQVIRSYIIDENHMIDNPYRLIQKTRQYEIFDIDGPNFVRVQSIQIFNKDFPNASNIDTNKLLTSGDIILSDFEITGAVRMTESQINGIAVSFYTPDNTFFTESDIDLEKSYRRIIAQVRIKGKLATAAQNISFYWGREERTSSDSKYYNRYLGRGWKCLNQFNIIQGEKNQDGVVIQEDIVQWVPGSDTYILYLKDALAENNKFRVAVVYDNTVVRKQINIQNFSSKYKITIESDSGTEFYYDNGKPNLTCLVGGQDDPKEQNGESLYAYYWQYVSKDGYVQPLNQTTQEQEISYNEEQLKYIQRVKKNKILNTHINSIISFGTFKCFVYQRVLANQAENIEYHEVFLGTGSIVLTNKLQSEGTYSLVIENGAAAFQYDENGVSPTNKSLDNPQTIQALSFTLYDNLGNPLNVNTFNSQIRWIFPIENTLLIEPDQAIITKPQEPNAPYVYIDNALTLTYQIANRYNVHCQNNQIKLQITYNKEVSLSAITQFTFVKQGEPGTNGTDYVVRILPNTTMNTPPQRPMITQIGDGDGYKQCIVNYGIASTEEETQITKNNDWKEFFKLQLWQSGQLIWQGISLDNYNVEKSSVQPDFIRWEVMKNENDKHIFDVQSIRGRFKYLGRDKNWARTAYACTVKCSISYQGKIYSGNISTLVAKVQDSKYRLKLKDNTGFNYVIYSSDGIVPQYDNNPFEFICQYDGAEVPLENLTYNVEAISKLILNDKQTQIINKEQQENEIEEQNLLLNKDFKKIIQTIQEKNEDGEIIKEYTVQPGPDIISSDGYITDSYYQIKSEEETEQEEETQQSNEQIPTSIEDNRRIDFINSNWKITLKPGLYTIKYTINKIVQNKDVLSDCVVRVINPAQSSIVYFDSQPSDFIKEGSCLKTFLIPRQTLVGVFIRTFDAQIKVQLMKNFSGEMDLNLLRVLSQRQNYPKNKFEAKPASRYDGGCVNIALLCTYRNIGSLMVPIHFLLNKYGMAHLNDWDGNSIKIDDQGGYILSPQMGAGKKNESNQFTGVLMGEVKEAGKSSTQTGLFGYAQGDRTFFLDSQTGGALFGKNGAGRIIINPNSDKAILVSNNYWSDNNFDDKGFPRNIEKEDGTTKDSDTKTGMLIDLSTPQIKFGSGHFSVTKEGNLFAQNGGQIAGWSIEENEIVSKPRQGEKQNTRLHLSSEGGRCKIYSNEHDRIEKTGDGFYLSGAGLSIGSKFKVTSKGVLTLGNNAVAQGDDKSKKYWTIDSGSDGQSFISYGSGNNQVYLGTDKIALGSKFSVTNEGQLTSKKGTIGGWKIENNIISAGNLKLHSNGEIQAGYYNEDGTQSGTGWMISSTGNAYFKKGEIGGWSLSGGILQKTSTQTFGTKSDRVNFKINGNTGAIYAQRRGNARKDKKGNIIKVNGKTQYEWPKLWSINSDGSAFFNNVTVSGKVGSGSLVGDGITINMYNSTSGGGGGGGGGGLSSINPNRFQVGKNQTLTDFMNKLAQGIVEAEVGNFDQIYAKKSQIEDLSVIGTLQLDNTNVGWGSVIRSINGATCTKDKDGYVTSVTIHYTTSQGLVFGQPVPGSQ